MTTTYLFIPCLLKLLENTKEGVRPLWWSGFDINNNDKDKKIINNIKEECNLYTDTDTDSELSQTKEYTILREKCINHDIKDKKLYNFEKLLSTFFTLSGIEKELNVLTKRKSEQ